MTDVLACRIGHERLLVFQSTPLSAVLDRLAVTLGVPRHRLLLLREEAELRADATVGEMGLGIADIIGQLPSAVMLTFQSSLMDT